jgi:transposase IS204/IS1001/IS1096/IS1165 family protein
VVEPTSAPAPIVADTIVRTVELGVRITDAAIAGELTVVFCELLTDGPGRCPGCGIVGVYRDTVERRVTDVPVVGHPLELRVRVPRYRCVHDGCVREVFCHDTIGLARPGWSTTRRCAQFILRRLMLDKATVTAVARELGRCWDTVNSIAVKATTGLLLTAGPARLDGVRVIGVDEHRWAHTRTAQVGLGRRAPRRPRAHQGLAPLGRPVRAPAPAHRAGPSTAGRGSRSLIGWSLAVSVRPVAVGWVTVVPDVTRLPRPPVNRSSSDALPGGSCGVRSPCAGR